MSQKTTSPCIELDTPDSVLEYKKNTLLAQISLYEFFKQAWPHIEGAKEFIGGKHIQIICEHLELVANRKIKRLLINLPPRFSKSTLISVAFPAWVWLRNPSERFLCSSYALQLANRDSRYCRTLIQSPWYQKNWSTYYSLLKDQNTKGRFDNTYKGYRIATSSKSAATGEGGSILICDDGNNIKDAQSETDRNRRLEWWSQIWSTRLNDKRNDCMIVVQQRTHEGDISGFIINNDVENNWVKLILPMEFELSRKSKTVVLPSTNGKIWEDWRTKEGELLWPQRIGNKEVAEAKNTLGSYGYAGQYQQRPSPAEGGIIKKAWFRWWKNSTPPQISFVLMSWDTALTANEMSAYSACTTWGVFYDENHIENVILLSMWRGRVEYPELREITKRLYFDYRDTGKEREPKFKGRNIDMCLIEAKASGDPLIQDLAAAGIRAIPFVPNKYGDKISRVRLITPLIEGGRIWLPARAPNYDALLPYADEFLESVSCFPNAESRDLVDTMAQAFLKLKSGHFVSNPKDERSTPPSVKEVRVY